jgi:hypothetical protein
MGEVNTIGLDIAKPVFQVHGVDSCGDPKRTSSKWRTAGAIPEIHSATPGVLNFARGSTTHRQHSVVKCREQLKRVGLFFVMIDEELRIVHCDHLPDLFHRRD